MVPWVAAALVGYVFGSIPVADLVARRRGVDLREVGDRNPGYWNAKEQFGGRGALPVLFGDTAKGMAAALVGVALASGHWGVEWVAVAGAMVGHGWPLFAHFRGGKSLLTFVGGMLVVTPVPALIGLAVLGLVSAVSTFALGIRVALFSFPVIQAFFYPRAYVAATGALMCIMALRFAIGAFEDARHRRHPGGDAWAGTPGLNGR